MVKMRVVEEVREEVVEIWLVKKVVITGQMRVPDYMSAVRRMHVTQIVVEVRERIVEWLMVRKMHAMKNRIVNVEMMVVGQALVTSKMGMV
jgi:hypothetical protein